MINKMVTFKVKPEALNETKILIRDFVENIILNEEDTLLYRTHQEKKDPTKFVHFMTFKDEYAEEQHRRANYCQEFAESLYPLCEEQPVYTDLERLAFHN